MILMILKIKIALLSKFSRSNKLVEQTLINGFEMILKGEKRQIL